MIRKICPKTINDFVIIEIDDGTLIGLTGTQLALANITFSNALETVARDLTLIDKDSRGRGDTWESLVKVENCQQIDQLIEMRLNNGSSLKLNLTEFKTLLSTRQ